MAKRYLSTAEYAAVRGLPERTVRARCERGAIRASKAPGKVRGHWRIPLSELERDQPQR